MDELPSEKSIRFVNDYKIEKYDADIISQNKFLSNYFEKCCKLFNKPKNISNWILSDLLRRVNEAEIEIEDIPVNENGFTELLKLIDEGKINNNAAKKVLREMFEKSLNDPLKIINSMGLMQISDDNMLLDIINEVLSENPNSITDFKAGKDRALGYLVGQAMKKSKGKGNPQKFNKLISEKLNGWFFNIKMGEKMKKIILASNNPDKIKELKEILKNLDYKIISKSEAGFSEDIEETGKTLEENASLKAKAIYEKAGECVISDDTGLFVEALKGELGVKTARYAGENCSYDDNVEKLLNNLKGEKNRKAYFKTVLVFIGKDGKEIYFEGKINGKIATEKKGDSGFGYDPIFIPEGYDESFAQLGLDTKNKISHRKLAMNKLLEFLKNN